MRALLAVSWYEVKLQWRSAIPWLLALGLLAFWWGDVRLSLGRFASYAVSSESIWQPAPGVGSVDRAAELQTALKLAPFSWYAARFWADLMGLALVLSAGFLSAFVWQQDQRWAISDVLLARPIPGWVYVLGKYLGVVMSWSLILGLVALASGGYVYWLTHRFGLSFRLADFLAPVFGWTGLSLLYGTALVLLLSLLLRDGVATLLVYFFYWTYPVSQLGMFRNAGPLEFLTYWLFRFNYFSSLAYELIDQQQRNLALNRTLYAALTLLLLAGLGIVFARRRRQGTFLVQDKPWSRLRARAAALLPSVPVRQPGRRPVVQAGWFTYQLRLIWRLNWWLAPLIALLVPLVMFLPPGPEWERRLWALRIGEQFLPVVGLLIWANLLSQEWENGTADLWLSRPVRRRRLLLARTALTAGYTLAAFSLPLVLLYLTYVRFRWVEMLLTVLPPAFFLGLLGVTVGIAAKHSTLAFLLPLLYWFFEMSTKGVYTGPFFLFARTGSPCPGSIESCLQWQQAGVVWLPSKLLLLVLSIGLLAATAWLLARAGRRSVGVK